MATQLPKPAIKMDETRHTIWDKTKVPRQCHGAVNAGAELLSHILGSRRVISSNGEPPEVDDELLDELKSITVRLGVQNPMWHFHMCVYKRCVVLSCNILTQCFLPHNAKLSWRSVHCGVSDERVGVAPGCRLELGGSVSSLCAWGMSLAWAARMSSTHSSFLVCACEGTGALTLRG